MGDGAKASFDSIGVSTCGSYGCSTGAKTVSAASRATSVRYAGVDARDEHEHERDRGECRAALPCPPLAAPVRIRRRPRAARRAARPRATSSAAMTSGIDQQRQPTDPVRAGERPDRERDEHERRQRQEEAPPARAHRRAGRGPARAHESSAATCRLVRSGRWMGNLTRGMRPGVLPAARQRCRNAPGGIVVRRRNPSPARSVGDDRVIRHGPPRWR